jgi:hypothetical protein
MDNNLYYINEGVCYKSVDINKYVANGLRNNTLIPESVVKTQGVYARKGVFGEKIVTKRRDGRLETVNCVSKDKRGNVDWVLTSKSGISYVCTNKAFVKKYEVDDRKFGFFESKLIPVAAFRIYENITFIAPWREQMYVNKNDYVIANSTHDIYGIENDEFFSTYQFEDSLEEDQRVKIKRQVAVIII